MKTVLFLAAILIIVLLGNIIERSSYSTLDTSMSSIYKDRLQVSHYIYEISNALYRKKMLLTEGVPPSKQTLAELQTHNQSINTLIADYEQTVLTKEEKQKWTLFKNNLAYYNQYEIAWINNTPIQEYPVIDRTFKATVQNLDALSNIQVGEGKYLLENTHSIVNNRLVFSSFEISMLIILGAFSLVIISATDGRIFKNTQNQALN